jgi:hypothetical protein
MVVPQTTHAFNIGLPTRKFTDSHTLTKSL